MKLLETILGVGLYYMEQLSDWWRRTRRLLEKRRVHWQYYWWARRVDKLGEK